MCGSFKYFEWELPPTPRLIYLNTWSLFGSPLWGGYGTFRKCGLSKGSISVGIGILHFVALSYFLFISSASPCEWNVLSPLSLPASINVLVMDSLSLSLKLQGKIKSFFYKLFSVMIVYHRNRKQTWIEFCKRRYGGFFSVSNLIMLIFRKDCGRFWNRNFEIETKLKSELDGLSIRSLEDSSPENNMYCGALLQVASEENRLY